mmetsp:Transcript_29138/g.49162  ORF Transcript_29138/g.49162 Transcript_29138/m.49162 type:complete len:118 (-) Transcript_29138:320-673(-)
MPPRKREDSKWGGRLGRWRATTAGATCVTWGKSFCVCALLVGIVAIVYRLIMLSLAADDVGTKLLLNADPQLLHAAFHSRQPHIFYCHERGNQPCCALAVATGICAKETGGCSRCDG